MRLDEQILSSFHLIQTWNLEGEFIAVAVFINDVSLRQVLKVAQWESFFSETHDLVQKHLPNSGYFTTLATLLLQKLIKTTNVNKITPDSTMYLRAYLDQLSKNCGLTGTGPDHEASLKACAALLNFGSAPGYLLLLGPLSFLFGLDVFWW